MHLHFHHDFKAEQLWHDAADFLTTTGGKLQLGVKFIRQAEGAGGLLVYFDGAISQAEKIIFSRYVLEHLQQSARERSGCAIMSARIALRLWKAVALP